MRYSNKVLDTVKGINIEFGKKKKEEEDGPKPRKNRKRDVMEEEAEPILVLVLFKK